METVRRRQGRDGARAKSGQVQDVLPPSIHPDTGNPYTWEPAVPERREDIPVLPGGLLALWQHGPQLKTVLDRAQPWAAPPPPRTYKGDGGSVTGAFNDRYDVREILERNNYAAKSAERYLSSHSSTGTPGIVVLQGDDGLERVYCHHASDPLYSEEHSHDAFSVFTTLEHDGDVKAAVRAADLGMSYKETSRSGQGPKAAQIERRTATRPRPMLTRLADVAPQDVAWLWHPYIPLGKLTLLEGDPGLGKTFLALTLASIITKGYPFPGQDGGMGGAREPENVLYMSAEDGLADTLRPRLDAAGADVSRVHALTGWQVEDAEGETVEGAVSLAHIAVLEQTMQEVQPRLVIVDPLQAYLGAGVDMHRANEVRPVLSALSNLSEKYNFAAVCIRHLGKAAKGRAIYAGLGSIDFAAAARSMLLVAEHPEVPHMWVMAHVKSSLAPAGKSISYEIKDGAILWAGPTEHTAEDLLVTKGFDNDRGSSDEASEFLKDFLVEGAQPAQDVLKAARDILRR